MSARQELISGTRELIEAIKPWLSSVSVLKWEGPEGFLPIIYRSVLIRQWECLKAAADLVERDEGYVAVPLLRAACEELLWSRYFRLLLETDAKNLAGYMIQEGLLRDLEAQAAEVGDDEMNALGLTAALERFRVRGETVRDELRELGKRLEWPEQSYRRGGLPSTWFIASKTESEDLYRFLYHATSRYVHFNVVELARRGWGPKGRIELSSATYEPVWAKFALAWGSRLFGWTLAAVIDALETEGVPEPDHAALQAAFDRITAVALVPLVTFDELRWHGSGNSA